MDESTSGVRHDLIELIDEAVRADDTSEITSRVAEGLHGLASSGGLRLPESLTRVRHDAYARRLFHRCPRSGYTVVVMTWGPGQHTPLHDHAGMWCVECVVEGELDVIQYDLTAERDSLCRFEPRMPVRARLGDAGCLIPPFEHHVLRNRLPDRRSVTLHVYAGEMDRCNVYLPRDGDWWERKSRALAYDD